MGKWAQLKKKAEANPLSKKVGVPEPTMPTPMPEIVMKGPHNSPSAKGAGGDSGGDQPIVRRKSMLPQDPATRRALEDHTAQSGLGPS